MAAFIKNIAIEDATGKQINHEIALNHKIAIGEYIFDGTADINIPDTALGGDMELTMAEYQALSEEEKMNGLTYYITDVDGNMPVIVLTKEEYDALGDDKYSDGNIYLISDDVGDWTATGVVYDNKVSGLEATNVGAALDELDKKIEDITGGTVVLDKANKDGNGNIITETYETKTDANQKLTNAKKYSDDKLVESKSYADTVGSNIKNDLLNGAGGAYDTLKELGDLIDVNHDAIDALEKVATGKADAVHSHDDRYYTESEMNTKLNAKQDASTAITTSNIANQSVNYAATAGSAGSCSGNAATATNATNHIANKSNPHGVTAAQIGLGNVNNTADSAKSVNYATTAGSANAVAWGNVSGKPSTFTPSSHTHPSTAITVLGQHKIDNNPVNNGGTQDLTVEGELVRYASSLLNLNNHITNKSNPHGVTKAQIGLGNVDNTKDSAKSVNYANSANTCNTANYTNYINMAGIDYSEIDGIKTPGLYKVFSTPCMILHLYWDNNFMWQVKFCFAQQIHVRVKIGGTWSDWSNMHSW